MLEHSTITSWLQQLNTLHPAQDLILVGAGVGKSKWTQTIDDLHITKALLIEADEKQFQLLKKNSLHNNWIIEKALIGIKKENTFYYEASYRIESGTIQPENFENLWPNIKTKRKIKYETSTLSELIAKTGLLPNWLIIDCFPSLSIIQGLEQYLDNFEVIIARTVLTDDAPDNTNINKLTEFLTNQGYHRLTTEQARNPAIGHALYFKDVNSDKLNTGYKNLEDKLTTSQDKHNELRKSYEEQTNVINQLIPAKNLAVKQEEILQVQIQQLSESQDSLIKVKTELEQQVAQLLENTSTQASTIENNKKEIENLYRQLQERDHRQELINEEFIKAEAQLETIKDMVSRDEKTQKKN